MNSIKSFGTFSCVFLYRTMRRGNQHGGRKCNDLPNRLDLMSHENPLLFLSLLCIMPLGCRQTSWEEWRGQSTTSLESRRCVSIWLWCVLGPDTWALVFQVPLHHWFHRETCQLKSGISEFPDTPCIPSRLSLEVLFSHSLILSPIKSVVPKISYI